MGLSLLICQKNIWAVLAMINSHLRVNGDLFMQDLWEGKCCHSRKVKVKSAQAAFLLSSTGLLIRKESSHPVLNFLNDWRMTVELNLSSSCPLD